MSNYQKPRRTKIMATLGPATDDPKILEELIKAGVDVVRLNFSHGDADDQRNRANMVRAASKKFDRHVGILADLQGPKIRIARFKSDKVTLEEGAPFIIDVNLDANIGDINQVGCEYKELAKDVCAGNRLLLDDGRIVLDVESVEGSKINCTVVVAGLLSNNKGINLQGGGLSARALTEKDKADIITAAEIGVDFVAVSFPRNAADMHEARALVEAAGSQAHLVAKIERAEALEVLEEIVDASDIVMVARGDLGVEIGDANLPPVQKSLIRLARDRNTAVITATQMMESMIENPIPTRAEVFDVANAVADGTDAVMLSAETSVGKYPVKTVEAMGRICEQTERQPRTIRSRHRMGKEFARIDEAIALSAMYVANHTNIQAIAAFTETGSTPMRMSRISSGIPIFAMVPDEAICRRVTMYRGVTPILMNIPQSSSMDINRAAMAKLKKLKIVSEDDLVIITTGELTGHYGGTNTLKIMQVE
ncbi:MAG TPA: pyruvate kinase [Cycloclasticus sp.]|nr:pyruvate kinase [Cycloclasticus sp.]HIL92329.1 pyruvate kinase [Cycloclasticus sp.]